MQLVGVASLVALPLSYLVLQRWLANYAFHISCTGGCLPFPLRRAADRPGHGSYQNH
jgi:hypothetical protein